MNGIARLATRRPRAVLLVWLALVAVLGLNGLGVGDRLSTHAIYIDGTATKREHEIALREFGGEDALIVMLRGPRSAVRDQGRQLAEALDAMPDTLVVSPWNSNGTIAGLTPSPGVAALLVSIDRPASGGVLETVSSLRRTVEGTVTEPVSADVAGGPAIIDSFHSAGELAATLGELIAIPVLLVVLLIVFRSLIAALIPIVVGGAVVVATRGVLELVVGAVEIDLFALGAVGMMGLALGVDYSLLVVSRFREEMRKGDGQAAAVRATVGSAGRSVVPAGCGLVFAMVVSAQVLPGAIVTSVAVVVTVVAVLSVLSALLVVPAILMLLGADLDRWALPQRRQRVGATARWSLWMSRRPRLALPIVLVLLVLASISLGLDTGVANVALLPPDDPGRRQQEEVQRHLGPGWVAPLEIAVYGRGRPVTTPERLRALASFQRRVERDPGVETMAGLAPIERGTRRLGSFEESLTAQGEGLSRLDRGIARAHDGAALNTSGLLQAAEGARQLDSALGATGTGAGALAGGLRSASSGSERLSGGLGEASEGSGKLSDSTAEASGGAGRLAHGLSRAREETGEVTDSARVMENAMHTGEQRLTELDRPLGGTEERLAAARQALQRMTTGRGDPEYAAIAAALDEASAWLTGIDPATGEAAASSEGVRRGVDRAQGQFSLGVYLSERMAKDGERAHEGMTKLARGSARLERGLHRLTAASERMSRGMVRLSRGGETLSPGLRRLVAGADRLSVGLEEVGTGASALAGGLGGGAQKSKLLSGALDRIHDGVERQRGSSGSGSGIDRLMEQSPDLFESGYFYLASLDGSAAGRRSQAGFLVNLDRGGQAARMLVIPRYDPASAEARETRDRLQQDAEALARETRTEVAVGGATATQIDLDSALRSQAPPARLALVLVTFLILVPVIRSLILPIVAGLLNVIVVAASFGLLSLLFDHSLLGGPGYVDTTVVPATIMVMFGLAIDYEVFVFARMREEYARTGSTSEAIANGIGSTAHVVTGAAVIMIGVFLAFAALPFATFRDFGVGQAIGVAIDAFLVRLVIVPIVMRALGGWSWWMPAWLDRLLPGGSQPPPAAGEVAR